VPSIKYSVETEVGLFNSTLTLPEDHTYTDEEIEQLKQAYADAYVIEMQIAEKTSAIRNLKQIEVMRRNGGELVEPPAPEPEAE